MRRALKRLDLRAQRPVRALARAHGKQGRDHAAHAVLAAGNVEPLRVPSAREQGGEQRAQRTPGVGIAVHCALSIARAPSSSAPVTPELMPSAGGTM